MSIDVLILNTAAVDLRRSEFSFVEGLVGPGGLAKCKTENMPAYSQKQYHDWTSNGSATAGGPGNAAPLIARAGLKVSVGVNVGKGDFDGLDACGRYFCDVMMENNVDISEVYVHPELPTGTVFICDKINHDRGGLCYFPNANDDFDLEYFKGAVERLKPKIVYYMYSGLSARADANGGKDLAVFIKWCRSQGCITLVDSATLAGDPKDLAGQGEAVDDYKLLIPVLPEVDLFFTSSDEAKLIANTFGLKQDQSQLSQEQKNLQILDFLSEKFWAQGDRTRIFGITTNNGVCEQHVMPGRNISGPRKITSRFMSKEVVDLVGAGDAFRAGLVSYIAKNLDSFRQGKMNFEDAIQMGNLFAATYIKSPLNDRYCNFVPFEKMLKAIVCDNE